MKEFRKALYVGEKGFVDCTKATAEEVVMT